MKKHKLKIQIHSSKSTFDMLLLGHPSQKKSRKGKSESKLSTVLRSTPLKRLWPEAKKLEDDVIASLSSKSWGSTQCNAPLYKKERGVLFFSAGQAKDCESQKLLKLGAKCARSIAKDLHKLCLFADSILWSEGELNGDSAKDFAGRKLHQTPLTKEEQLEKFLTGFYLSRYEYKDHKGKNKSTQKLPEISIFSEALSSTSLKSVIKRVQIIVEGVFFARDLQNEPSNYLYPEELAKKAKALESLGNCKVKVFNEKKLESLGMGGILSVGKGSIHPPRLIIMEYNGAKKSDAPALGLVGKGITFDTGGISLKPPASMFDMKMDMGGAAMVLGAMSAIVQLKLPINVVALVASAENMPSDRAIKPSDVYTAYNGKTVEVLNTDAEGRLVLGDALSYMKEFNPGFVIDLATLTGAVVVALGGVTSGMMGNNAEAIERMKSASAKAGEKVWELPLHDEYAKQLKSTIADLKNIGGGRAAGALTAGCFLNEFVEEAYPWVHLDIAGSSDSPKDQGPHCPDFGGTGVPVQSLVTFAEELC